MDADQLELLEERIAIMVIEGMPLAEAERRAWECAAIMVSNEEPKQEEQLNLGDTPLWKQQLQEFYRKR